jgi:hypothetical protein
MITIHRSGENKGIQLALIQTDLSEELSGCTTFERRLTSSQLLKPNPSHLHKLSWWTGGEQYVARSPGDLQAEDVQKLNVLTKFMGS